MQVPVEGNLCFVKSFRFGFFSLFQLFWLFASRSKITRLMLDPSAG